MGLKDLHLLAGDDGAANPANQLLGLAAEHHARDDLDPSGTGELLEHLIPHEARRQPGTSARRHVGTSATTLATVARSGKRGDVPLVPTCRRAEVYPSKSQQSCAFPRDIP